MATSSASSLWQKMRAPGRPCSAGDRAAAQRGVDVDVAVGDDLRARIDRRQHDQVGVLCVDHLAAAYRLVIAIGPAWPLAAGTGARPRARERGAGERCPRRPRTASTGSVEALGAAAARRRRAGAAAC